jgi:hypothetical protein
MVLGLVLVGCGMPAAPTTAKENELLPDPATGFVVLAVRSVSYVKIGRLWVANDKATFGRLWTDLEIPGPVADADFGSYVVVLFADYDTCHGGNGWSELRRVFVRADGFLRPQFARIDDPVCEQDTTRATPTVAYAIALRRESIPRGRLFGLAPAQVVRLRKGADSEPAGPDDASPEPELSSPWDRDSILQPPSGALTKLAYLGDGTAVFIVRHVDSTLDVFAADAPSWFDVMKLANYPLSGLRTLLEWDAAARTFRSSVGTYDEYGVPVLALQWATLDRYRFTLDAHGSLVVPVDGRVSGYGPRKIAARPLVAPGPAVRPYGRLSPLDLSRALAQPAGSRVVLTADLELGAGIPRLCDRVAPDCSGASVRALGLTWGAADHWGIAGPFVARVSEGGVSDLTAQGPYYVPRTEPKLRPREFRDLKIEGAVLALSEFAGDTVSLGAQASIAARLTPWKSYSLLPGLIGEDMGLSIRARWLSSVTSGTRDLRIGIAPILEDSNLYRDWSYPSPMGLFAPEVGFGRRSGGLPDLSGQQADETMPYVGWSLPITRRFVSPLVRRHPFDANDVLGIRIAAEAHFLFPRAGIEKAYALSAGLTVW